MHNNLARPFFLSVRQWFADSIKSSADQSASTASGQLIAGILVDLVVLVSALLVVYFSKQVLFVRLLHVLVEVDIRMLQTNRLIGDVTN